MSANARFAFALTGFCVWMAGVIIANCDSSRRWLTVAFGAATIAAGTAIYVGAVGG